MAVIARGDSREWRRRTTGRQLAIWAAWLVGLMIFVYCWQMISDRTIWEFAYDAPTQAADLGRRMVPPDWLYIADTLMRGTDADRVAAWNKYATAGEWDARLKTDLDAVWAMLPNPPPPVTCRSMASTPALASWPTSASALPIWPRCS